MVVNPRRFRFSIGTYMAEEGASVFHIAEILDHTDTQNVRVYVETVSSIADPVAKATDAALAPLVQRFQGKIVDSPEVPAFDGMPNQVIPAIAPHLGIVHLNVGGVGHVRSGCPERRSVPAAAAGELLPVPLLCRPPRRPAPRDAPLDRNIPA